MNPKKWREFADWVQEMVKLEALRVTEELNGPDLERQQGRRDAFEDVWVMVLAFQRDWERQQKEAG